MSKLGKMLRRGEYETVWKKYCGFLDLSIDEFMQIQERLLMEQIELLSQCKLGEKIIGKNNKPSSVEEFRQLVPLTTYEDYAQILLNKKEEQLPSKPLYWIKTTWKGGSNEFKIAPYSESMIEEHTKAFLASLILATSKKRGDFSLREYDKFLYGMAPLPYLTGLAPHCLKNEIEFEYLPSIEEAERLSFEQRNRVGFELAAQKGIDLFFGLSSVLVKIAEDFVHGSKSKKHTLKLINPKMFYKLFKIFIKKYVQKQTILPKDLWDVKGILCAGTDSHAFKEKIEYYWGKQPLEIYGGTEITVAATETWGDSGLTFFPDVNFLEFIPEKDSLKSLHNPNYKPKTLLFNEIKPNERYELVITKFRGGAFVRYRVGDIIECTALQNETHQIYLPQIRFIDRISNVIDLAGFTRITTSMIDTAISLAQLSIKNWVVCKEYEDKEPILHIYIEMNETDMEPIIIKQKLHETLQQLDSDYRDLEEMLGRDCLRVTLLPHDSFKTYSKPIMKMNPNQDTIRDLINSI